MGVATEYNPERFADSLSSSGAIVDCGKIMSISLSVSGGNSGRTPFNDILNGFGAKIFEDKEDDLSIPVTPVGISSTSSSEAAEIFGTERVDPAGKGAGRIDLVGR